MAIFKSYKWGAPSKNRAREVTLANMRHFWTALRHYFNYNEHYFEWGFKGVFR